ncbi:hypothetical protein [uncultured Roseibium sp.]|uniref:hypothetical protein n=1 Tax=uncultured Roseibium sp. TaxID=1936171 RepID=UPI00321714CE
MSVPVVPRCVTRLQARFGNHPHVGDVRGRGLLQAIELVEHRDTKTPFSPERRLGAEVKKTAMALGLLVYPGSGTIDGVSGDHILLAPPYNADAETHRSDYRDARRSGGFGLEADLRDALRLGI